ncbi:MAG: ribonuclease HII [Deltaproteobacteria bacterium]|nr:ribonuclease HII [Deltaproteobacteria bacterium]
MDRFDDLPALTAGVDEAGRGCLAGPVVAAAVILPPDLSGLEGLGDSKTLTARARARLETEIKRIALAWALGLSWPREIERINILQASLTAMTRSVRCLHVRPELVLVDGNQVPDLEESCRALVKGDSRVRSISAASILAKTFRDRLMVSLDRRYPGYGLAGHKGYGTREHLERVRALGPSPIHRMTFRGVRRDRGIGQPCLPI